MKTMTQVVNIVGLSKRQIQEAQYNKLVEKPKHKNKYGYYMYDDQDIERLWMLRFYHEIGYKKQDIERIRTVENYDEKEALNKIVAELFEKREKIDNLLNIAQMMKETGLSFNSLRRANPISEKVESSKALNMLGAVIGAMKIDGINDEEIFNTKILSEDELNNVIDEMLELFERCKKVTGGEDDMLQSKLLSIHRKTEKVFSDSVLVFQSFLPYLVPESELAKEFEEEIGKEEILVLHDAVQVYCKKHAKNPTDIKIDQTFSNLENLWRNGSAAESEKVQYEIGELHGYLKRFRILTEKAQLDNM